MSNMAPGTTPQRKKRRLWLWILLVLALIVLAAIWFVNMLLNGGKPLVNNMTLADGKVEIVTDGFIATYIIELADGSIALIDAGFDPEARAIAEALGARDRALTDITAVLITHAHGDHIAGIAALPEAELYVLAPDADLLEGRRVADSPFASGREPELTGFTADHPLSDGDMVVLGGTGIEVFAVPGHTRGSAAFLVHGVLFLGDSAAATRDDTLIGAPPVFSADRERNAASLKALVARLEPRREEIDALAFGHQGPLEGLQPLIDWAQLQH